MAKKRKNDIGDDIIEGLDRYDDGCKPLGKMKIIVSSEHDKEQLIKALWYIDGMYRLDTEYVAVDCLVHILEENIIVEPKENA